MCVIIYVCVYVRGYFCMCVIMYMCVRLCVCPYVRVCVYACVIFMYVRFYVYVYVYVCVCVCLYMYAYVSVRLCIYVCLFIYERLHDSTDNKVYITSERARVRVCSFSVRDLICQWQIMPHTSSRVGLGLPSATSLMLISVSFIWPGRERHKRKT